MTPDEIARLDAETEVARKERALVKEDFHRQLQFGNIAEIDIVRRLEADGHIVEPMYGFNFGKEKAPMWGKYIAPDLKVFLHGKQEIIWVEVKRKSHATFYRRERRFVTGVNCHPFDNYEKVQEDSGLKVLFFFVHDEPDDPDHTKYLKEIRYTGPGSPAGIYSATLDTLNQDKRKDGYKNNSLYYFPMSLMTSVLT